MAVERCVMNGHTLTLFDEWLQIFPLCGSKPKHGNQKGLGEFNQQLNAVWGTAAEGYSRSASFDINMEHPFNDLLAEACKGELGVGVQPRKGDAIMFDAVTQAGDRFGTQPQTRTWHGGCNVLEGEKTILVSAFITMLKLLTETVCVAKVQGARDVCTKPSRCSCQSRANTIVCLQTTIGVVA